MVRRAVATMSWQDATPLGRSNSRNACSAQWCMHSSALGQLVMAVESSICMEASQTRWRHGQLLPALPGARQEQRKHSYHQCPYGRGKGDDKGSQAVGNRELS